MAKYLEQTVSAVRRNVTLTADHAYKIGRFIGWYYGRKKREGQRCKVLIGKDTRLSSYMFEFDTRSRVVQMLI